MLLTLLHEKSPLLVFTSKVSFRLSPHAFFFFLYFYHLHLTTVSNPLYPNFYKIPPHARAPNVTVAPPSNHIRYKLQLQVQSKSTKSRQPHCSSLFHTRCHRLSRGSHHLPEPQHLLPAFPTPGASRRHPPT